MKYLTVKNYKEIESAKHAVIDRVNEAQKLWYRKFPNFRQVLGRGNQGQRRLKIR